MKLDVVKRTSMIPENPHYYKINVKYDFIGGRVKNKTFAIDDIKTAVEFANTKPDKYIEHCSTKIKDWIIEHNHDILRTKNWCFE